MEPETKSSGSVVGLVVIIIILVIGGIYIWTSNKNTLGKPSTPGADNNTVTSQDSSEVDSLEQESNTVDVNAGVDYENVN